MSGIGRGATEVGVLPTQQLVALDPLNLPEDRRLMLDQVDVLPREAEQLPAT